MITMNAPSMIGMSDEAAAISLCTMGLMALKGHVSKNCPHPVPPPPSSCADLGDHRSQTSGRIENVDEQRRTKGKLPLQKGLGKSKATKKCNPAVSYEEMTRLMRVYGPTKCLRNRTPKESGKGTKIPSIKRKFYRWFPDFHERFRLVAPGGWYVPEIGHEREMEFREELRREDQMLLSEKRSAKRRCFKK